MNRNAVYFLIILCAAAVAQLVSAQDTIPTPIPDPVPNGEELYGGPLENLRDAIVDRIEKRIDEKQKQDSQEMTGFLNRLRERDEITAKEFAALRDWFQVREEQDQKQFGELKGILQQLRDRPPLDTSGLFPRIAEVATGIKDMRAEQTARWTPLLNIVERFENLTKGIEKLVWNLVYLVLAACVLMFVLAIVAAFVFRAVRKAASLPADALLGKE